MHAPKRVEPSRIRRAVAKMKLSKGKLWQLYGSCSTARLGKGKALNWRREAPLLRTIFKPARNDGEYGIASGFLYEVMPHSRCGVELFVAGSGGVYQVLAAMDIGERIVW